MGIFYSESETATSIFSKYRSIRFMLTATKIKREKVTRVI